MMLSLSRPIACVYNHYIVGNPLRECDEIMSSVTTLAPYFLVGPNEWES